MVSDLALVISALAIQRIRTFCAMGLCIAAGLLTTTPAVGCNVPVFRYALERWSSDDYELAVFHSSALSQSTQSFLHGLEQKINSASVGGFTSKDCNLRIVLVDLDRNSNSVLAENNIADASEAGFRQHWNENLREQHSQELPYAVLRSIRIAGNSLVIWHGKLEKFDYPQFLDSPIRSELCQRMMRGDSVVWLMVRSTQATKNESTRTTLKNKSRELSRSLELPDGIGLPGSELYSEVPLLLEFSVLEVDRTDRRESYLLDLLAKLDPESWTADEPLVVPVFGRGRALEVIPGNRLDAGMVGDLALFLSGACSCQVKERNPGFDLLLNMNWHQQLFVNGVPPPPPDEGLKASTKIPALLQIPAGKPK